MRLDFSDEKFPGILICFCGLDGAGKTTQIEILKNRIIRDGYGEPTCTFQPTKEMRQNFLFRKFVDGKKSDYEAYEYRSLSLLTVSDRLQHSRHVILPQLLDGKIVISDRYFYTALINLRARGYKEDKWIYEIAKYIPKPDLTFFINVDFDEAMRRVRSREEEKDRYIHMKFHKKLWEEYQYISHKTDCIILDNKLCIEEMATIVYEEFLKAIEKKGGR